jgi:hypothetical protein
MSDGGAQILDVTGGAGGLEAAYAAVRGLASTYDAAGDVLRDWAGTGRRVLTDDDLVESSVLCPATFLLAEAAVVAATTGRHGLLPESLGWELDAVGIRTAVATLEAADEGVHESFEVLDYTLGRALGTYLRLSAPLVVGGAANTLTGLALLDQVRPGSSAQLLGGAATIAEDQLTSHPGVLEHLMNGGGGLLDGLTGGLALSPTTEVGAAEVAGLYGDDGSPDVTRLDLELPGSSIQPGSLQDLIEHLGEVAVLSPTADAPLNGTIGIQTITGPDGDRHIVFLPGTDDLGTLPWTQDGDVRDMGTNLQLVAGQLDTYQEGILQAMRDAGVRPGEPVLVVGHSQGGMEAAAILAGDHGYDVTDVLTAGSPTAQVDGFPHGSHVTSLEQHGDVVPLLDGEPNPDSVEQTTVVFDAGPEGGVTSHHSYAVYADGAAAADASSDPSLVENIDSLHQHGFLAGLGDGHAHVTSQVLQITREPR